MLNRLNGSSQYPRRINSGLSHSWRLQTILHNQSTYYRRAVFKYQKTKLYFFCQFDFIFQMQKKQITIHENKARTRPSKQNKLDPDPTLRNSHIFKKKFRIRPNKISCFSIWHYWSTFFYRYDRIFLLFSSEKQVHKKNSKNKSK